MIHGCLSHGRAGEAGGNAYAPLQSGGTSRALWRDGWRAVAVCTSSGSNLHIAFGCVLFAAVAYFRAHRMTARVDKALLTAHSRREGQYTYLWCGLYARKYGFCTGESAKHPNCNRTPVALPAVLLVRNGKRSFQVQS